MLFYGLPDRRASHCAEPQARVSGRLCVPGSTSIPVMPGISFVTSLVPQKFFRCVCLAEARRSCASSPLRRLIVISYICRLTVKESADAANRRMIFKWAVERNMMPHTIAARLRADAFSPFPRTPTHNACGIFATKKHRKPKPSMLFGAGGVTRTHDLLITNQLLYRLSYTSVVLSNYRGSIQTQNEFYHKVLCASSNFLWFSFGDHEFFPRPPH